MLRGKRFGIPSVEIPKKRLKLTLNFRQSPKNKKNYRVNQQNQRKKNYGSEDLLLKVLYKKRKIADLRGVHASRRAQRGPLFGVFTDGMPTRFPHSTGHFWGSKISQNAYFLMILRFGFLQILVNFQIHDTWGRFDPRFRQNFVSAKRIFSCIFDAFGNPSLFGSNAAVYLFNFQIGWRVLSLGRSYFLVWTVPQNHNSMGSFSIFLILRILKSWTSFFGFRRLFLICRG